MRRGDEITCASCQQLPNCRRLQASADEDHRPCGGGEPGHHRPGPGHRCAADEHQRGRKGGVGVAPQILDQRFAAVAGVEDGDEVDAARRSGFGADAVQEHRVGGRRNCRSVQRLHVVASRCDARGAPLACRHCSRSVPVSTWGLPRDARQAARIPGFVASTHAVAFIPPPNRPQRILPFNYCRRTEQVISLGTQPATHLGSACHRLTWHPESQYTQSACRVNP